MDHLYDFSQSDIVKLNSSRLQDFKNIALENTKKRYRYCMQDSPENLIHDMFICRVKGDYCRPDKHENIAESHTIIEGRELIILFSDEGGINDAFILDRDGEYLSYRINTAIYHMTIPLSETAIDYEVKRGPFSPETNIFPEWAPDGENKEIAEKFLNEIIDKARHFLRGKL